LLCLSFFLRFFLVRGLFPPGFPPLFPGWLLASLVFNSSTRPLARRHLFSPPSSIVDSYKVPLLSPFRSFLRPSLPVSSGFGDLPSTVFYFPPRPLFCLHRDQAFVHPFPRFQSSISLLLCRLMHVPFTLPFWKAAFSSSRFGCLYFSFHLLSFSHPRPPLSLFFICPLFLRGSSVKCFSVFVFFFFFFSSLAFRFALNARFPVIFDSP